VELHIFGGAQRVVEALRGHDCSEALAWCEDNRARLRKAKSKLEFKLRVQVGAGGGCWYGEGAQAVCAGRCW
jgi:hypothetical protein